MEDSEIPIVSILVSESEAQVEGGQTSSASVSQRTLDNTRSGF